MEKGFDHLRCPMCGGELIYSEGTHDLCCRNNRYERVSEEEWEASFNEVRAGYMGEKSGGYI
jgi:galactose-1-phosphate uridylyltransferase